MIPQSGMRSAESAAQLRAAVWAALLLVLLLPGLAAAEPAATAAATSGASAEKANPGVSRFELGLMILVTSAIFMAAILITRWLLSRKIFKSRIILLPILIGLSGAAWLEMTLAHHKDVDNLYALVRFLCLFLAFVWVLWMAAKAAVPSEAQRTRAGLPPLIRTVAVLFAAFLGLFLMLMWSFPGLSLTPIFGAAGIVTIIVGLGLQTLLGNLVAGVLLSADRPFAVGDWVQIGDVEGEVMDIGWRSTRLCTRQHDSMEIPNSVILQARLVNFSQPSSLHLLRIPAAVPEDTPPGLASRALLEAVARVEGVLTRPAPAVQLKDFGDGTVTYELQAWVDNYEPVPLVESDLRREIWYAFKRNGLTMGGAARDDLLRQERLVRRPRARLVAAAGLPRGVQFELDGDLIRIGRDPHSQVCIADQRVSAEHAVIELKQGRFLLRDLGSHLGTQVNGRSVTTVPLRSGDEIVIGHVKLVFELSHVPEPDFPPACEPPEKG